MASGLAKEVFSALREMAKELDLRSPFENGPARQHRLYGRSEGAGAGGRRIDPTKRGEAPGRSNQSLTALALSYAPLATRRDRVTDGHASNNAQPTSCRSY